MAKKLNLVSLLFKRLDEILFNFRGKAVKDYQGTCYILHLPAIAGLAVGIFVVIKLCQHNAHEQILDDVKFAAIVVWLVNEILLIKHVFVLPGIFRKLFYPFFVAIVTLFVFSLICWGTIILSFIVIGIFMIAILIGAAGQAFKSNAHSSMPASVTSAKQNTQHYHTSSTVEQVEVDDGSVMGRKVLTKTGFDTWTDDSGKEYESSGFGTSFHEK